METTSKEKLNDYVSWFVDDLNDSLVFPIGAIIYSPQSLHIMAEELKSNGVVPLRYLLDEHPDVAIEKLFNFFEREKVVALFIKDEIPLKLLNAIRDIQEGKINMNLAGKAESSVLNPIPNGSKLILLVDEKNFDNLGIEKFALSVCRMEQ
jgi:hypothetical protein